MKKRLLMLLCAGVLAMSCLCACGGETVGSAGGEGSETAGGIVGEITAKDKESNFTGMVDGIKYDIYYDEDLESNSVACVFTNTESDSVQMRDAVITLYDESGEVIASTKFDIDCLESNVPYVMGENTKVLIGDVEIQFKKEPASQKTMGGEYVEISGELIEQGANVTIKNISDDKEIYYPEVCMLFFNDGEFVRYTAKHIEGEKSGYLRAQEEVTFEKTIDMDVDEVVYYFRSSNVVTMQDE